MSKKVINSLRAGDIVLYRSFLFKKQGRVTALAKDKSSCIIEGRLVKIEKLDKILFKAYN